MPRQKMSARAEVGSIMFHQVTQTYFVEGRCQFISEPEEYTAEGARTGASSKSGKFKEWCAHLRVGEEVPKQCGQRYVSLSGTLALCARGTGCFLSCSAGATASADSGNLL